LNGRNREQTYLNTVKQGEALADEELISHKMIEAELVQLLANGIAELAPDYRRIFELSYYEGKNPREIAGQAPVTGQPNVYANWGTTVQEMKLIIAEAAARANDLTVALKQLDEVRKNRIPAANYQPYASTDAVFVLEKVLEERRFEFPFTGLRWLDMRRLDAEGRTAPFYRLNAQGDVIATLEPRSNRYVLQVPAMVIQYNPAIQQNP
jgi:hypothetical protein